MDSKIRDPANANMDWTVKNLTETRIDHNMDKVHPIH